MPRLPRGEYAAVALSPLAETPFEPDVVIVEGLPEQIMWLALAERFEEGGRLEFSTAVLQATCVDGAVLPFVEQRINASFGCYGCRDATDFGPEEGVIGFPGYDLERIVAALEQLAAKAMPRVRAKTAGAVQRADLPRQPRPQRLARPAGGGERGPEPQFFRIAKKVPESA